MVISGFPNTYRHNAPGWTEDPLLATSELLARNNFRTARYPPTIFSPTAIET
jgi:hypothetical protein